MIPIGISGRIAKAFIESKLTPLIIIASLLLGVFALIVTPREEEPQIVVPMIDVMVSYPGASAKEVEDRVTKPMEKFLWEIDGVEYLYSMSSPDSSITIVRFYVGEDMEESLVKLYNKLMSNFDRIPPGVSTPLVKPKTIDDVPILTFTLWGGGYDSYELRRVAAELADDLKKDREISEVKVTGGLRREMRVTLDPASLKAYGLSSASVAGMLEGANFMRPSGRFYSGNEEFAVESGSLLEDAEDVSRVVVGVHDGRPVYLGDVATITDGPEEPVSYVFMGHGPASGKNGAGLDEAVTISIAKKKGTNATNIAERTIGKIHALKGGILPTGVEVTVTRNYGETAKEKSDELLKHMLIAAVSVTVLVALVLGFMESIVVAVAVPVTLALTILVTYIYGYTLNRVTLFALIFSIGILVDDAIVIVENIHRHFKMGQVSTHKAVLAVDEVGNPTILATFTVIAALLPMAFVSGLMGPYMRPIPVGASAAMIISLLIALIISPWLSYRVLRNKKHNEDKGTDGENRFIGYLNGIYEKNLRWLLESSSRRMIAILSVVLMLVGSMALVYFKLVTVKMLPFDNKSELQIVVDMPEGSTLEQTNALSVDIGHYLGKVPEVEDYQIYSGTASPFNFNGLVRHYFMRSGSNVSDIQVNFVPRHERKTQSHDIAKRIRPAVTGLGKKYGASVKVVEIPPGPPVLSTLVAEVYGPEQDGQIEIASKIKGVFENTDGVVDVDWFVESDQPKYRFEVDREKAAINGLSVADASRELAIALGGLTVGLAHIEGELEPVPIRLRSPIQERSAVSDLKESSVVTPAGKTVSLAELVDIKKSSVDHAIYRKNLKRVVYVTGEVAGTEESPVYAIMKMKDAVSSIKLPEGYELEQHTTAQPWLDDRYSMKWDGEWHITYEVFRDMGIAFAAVLILIYVMVVGWFKSFTVPLVIMAPIPLSLVGILPGHALMGAFFTATSMIGFIAGAGIVVRNSIILVDFMELKLSEGLPLNEAVVQAGIIRFRPMLLTAAAVVVGSSVILFDPIFQGMAISLMAGEVASTLLSRTMVPVLYYMYRKHEMESTEAAEGAI